MTSMDYCTIYNYRLPLLSRETSFNCLYAITNTTWKRWLIDFYKHVETMIDWSWWQAILLWSDVAETSSIKTRKVCKDRKRRSIDISKHMETMTDWSWWQVVLLQSYGADTSFIKTRKVWKVRNMLWGVPNRSLSIQSTHEDLSSVSIHVSPRPIGERLYQRNTSIHVQSSPVVCYFYHVRLVLMDILRGIPAIQRRAIILLPGSTHD